ncbi:MAG TPA: glutaredoxin family protein [Accumulibacter sp.]|uniref:glutaredoxin family protein n=1 Tax=Accumulibacter sp. TaxID=2053492 RepID=UPI002C2B6E04|nr:glutaredoxin family protein [Accumulibacter sp.]HNJ50617.1 glutaredoxin family protein [Accumulibacter sp.]
MWCADSFRRAALFLSLLLAATTVNGQTTYRWIDAKTGRTVISDHPPPADARQVTIYKGQGSSGESAEKPAPAPLSYAARQASEKFPVVLYTAAECDECRAARDLLTRRGIPFTEKLLRSQAEFAEVNQQLGGRSLLPSLVVGRKNLRGFASGDWSELLDLAGYPASTAYGSGPGTPKAE